LKVALWLEEPPFLDPDTKTLLEAFADRFWATGAIVAQIAFPVLATTRARSRIWHSLGHDPAPGR
jgi:hypothetical protein